MFLLIPETLHKLKDYYRSYCCPRCHRHHGDIYEWAACRWWSYHRPLTARNQH